MRIGIQNWKLCKRNNTLKINHHSCYTKMWMLHLSMVLLSTTGKDLTTSNGQVKVVYMRVSYGNFFILPLCYAELGQGKYWESVMQIFLKGFYIGWFGNIHIIHTTKTNWKATHILSFIESARLNPSRRLYYIKYSNEIFKLKSNEPALWLNKFVESNNCLASDL